MVHVAAVRRRFALLTLTVLSAFVAAPPSATAQTARQTPLRVLTRNLYLGADLTPAIAAGSPGALASAAAAIWEQVQATDFPARAELLADEVEDADLTLVGLQEVALWRTGDPDGPPALGGGPATDVAFDYLQILLDALAARGLAFQAVVVQQEADLEAPTTLGFDVRLTMRDAILARSGRVEISNPQSANFVNNLSLPLAGGLASVTSTRGWTAVDALVDRSRFRFVNTHLEAFSNFYRSAQAMELLAGPLHVPDRSVILVGDLNSDPDDPAFTEPNSPFNTTNPYDILTAGRFKDTWVLLPGNGAGNTCCNDADLLNPVPAMFERIDHVMISGGGALRPSVIGVDPGSRTATGLWPSDHAGVVAGLLP